MAGVRLYKNVLDATEQALRIIFEENKYADNVIEKVLKQNPKWGSRDRRFIAETTYDIVRWYRLILNIAEIKEEDPTLFFQLIEAWIVFKKMDVQIPEWLAYLTIDHAKIHENYLAIQDNRVIRESIPDWLDDLGMKALPDRWEKEIHSMNEQARVVLRVNSSKTNADELQHILRNLEVETEKVEGVPDALILKKRMNVFKLDPFKLGLFEMQDVSSQKVAPMLKVEPGMRVIDACAGAGGKTLHIASFMKNKGRLIALDNEQWKLDELKRRARRAGEGIIETRLIDSSKVIKRLHDSADRVILDVPCSGLGVLRRNPDAKWKLGERFINAIQDTQLQILNSYSKMLKKNGYLLYVTCSILPDENQNQVAKFLSTNKNFTLEEEQQIFPSEGFDGFYMARMKRVE
jgi:16S rRNA (cytosine967-C5)-methyltransferase